jgi:glycosyltransferase involved in cell wall biosynthesis
MRVALVGPLPPPSGGMANQTLQLKRLLSEEGVDVDLVQVNAPYRPAIIEGVRGLRAVFRLMPYLGRLWRAVGQADVVHVMANSGWSWHLFAAPAIWLGKWRGTPVVVNYRGGYAREFLQEQSAIVAFSLHRAARLIVPSDFLQAVFDDFNLNSEVVPNVVDCDRFKPMGGIENRSPTILVARNLEPIYGNDTAIRAFKLVRQSLPEARMIVAGSGPEEASLKVLVQELGLDGAVEFTGRVDTLDMPSLYHRASVALNPSLVDNMPNSVLEALAAGIPVVSTEVGGVPYIVRHEVSALLVPPGNETAMAEAIVCVLKNKSFAKQIAAAGLEVAARYSWPNVKETLRGIYRQVAGDRMSRRLKT